MDDYVKRKEALDDLLISEEIDFEEWQKKTMELRKAREQEDLLGSLSEIEERLSKLENGLDNVVKALLMHLESSIEISKHRCDSMFDMQQSTLWRPPDDF